MKTYQWSAFSRRLTTQSDLTDLSESVKDFMRTGYWVPVGYTTSSNGKQRVIDDSFYQEFPWCEIFYSKVLLFKRLRDLASAGASEFEAFPETPGHQIDDPEFIRELPDTAVIMVERKHCLILKNSYHRRSRGDGYGDQVKRAQVIFPDGSDFEFIRETDNVSIKKLTVEEACDARYRLETKVSALWIQRSSIQDWDNLIEVCQAARDLIGDNYFIQGIRAGMERRSSWDIFEDVWAVAKTCDQIRIVLYEFPDIYLFLE